MGCLDLGHAEADEKEEEKNPNGQSNEEKFHTVNHLVKIGLLEESPDSSGINRIMNSYLGR